MTNQVFDYWKSTNPSVIAKMIWYQYKQGRELTCSTELDSRGFNKGFSWGSTSEGISFWSKVCNGKAVAPTMLPEQYKIGDTITIMHNNKEKKVIFIKWDLEHFSFWIMFEGAWLKFNSREPGEKNVQEITKMPISAIIWNHYKQ